MPRHSAWKYWPLSLVARLTGATALKPIRNSGGEQSIQTEIQRLKFLQEAGVHVPEVLATADNGFMLADMGSDESPARPLVKAMKHASSAEDCLFWMQKGAEALVSVHAKGCWLSEAFGRNILIDGEGEIAFIDFEVDPVEALSFVDCCVRDWLLFVFSCIKPLMKKGFLDEGYTTLFQSFELEQVEVKLALFENISKLLWLDYLPLTKMGADGLAIKHTLDFLNKFRLESN